MLMKYLEQLDRLIENGKKTRCLSDEIIRKIRISLKINLSLAQNPNEIIMEIRESQIQSRTEFELTENDRTRV